MNSEHSYPADIQDALDKFKREAGQIIASFLKSLESQKPPSIIYHYTDDVGLKGILESGKIRLTDIFDLNDPSELNHGISLAIKVLNKIVSNGPPEGRIFAEQLTAFPWREEIRGSAYFFVCSFSSCNDDLCQWRAYADNGRGYALGFDATALEKGFIKGGAANTYDAAFPVTYRDAELEKLHGQIIDKMLGLISLPRGRGLQSGAIKSYTLDLRVALMTHLSHAALFFKHKAYENEKEYRFLRMHRFDAPPLEMKLRARRYSLIKCIEFGWRSATARALKEIVIGPAAHYEKASQFARDCLRSWNAGTIPIISSDIPYRAM
jgi:hypothetical protein